VRARCEPGRMRRTRGRGVDRGWQGILHMPG
jgi:hypothetical protein